MGLQTTAEQVRQQMVSDHSNNWGMDINKWDWVPGVGVIALLEYGQATHQAEIGEYLLAWVKRNHSLAAREPVVNAIAPYAIFPALYRQTGEEWLLEEALRIAEWLITQAPRTRERAFEHTVTENVAFAEQVWADTIFMAVLFLARTARLTGNTTYADEAVEQMLIHLRLLQEETSGVLFHGWNCAAGDHMSGARWTRANAWLAAGIPLIVEELAGLIPLPAELTERYSRLIIGLIAYQQEDGLWSTVLDQPGFYREISGSAGIAYGIRKAHRTGLLEADPAQAAAAERALVAIVPWIDETGIVGGVSGGTPVMPSVAAYNEIPVYPALYGQGLVLLLLSEALEKQSCLL
jgi:unsaturated rhamnogalacturonyl hydrolase